MGRCDNSKEMSSKIQLKLCRNLKNFRIPLQKLSVNGYDIAIGVVIDGEAFTCMTSVSHSLRKKKVLAKHRTEMNEKSILTLLFRIVPGLFQFLGIAELQGKGILKLLLKRKLVSIVKDFMVSGSFISL